MRILMIAVTFYLFEQTKSLSEKATVDKNALGRQINRQ